MKELSLPGKPALLLQGGSLRGLYTSGVLDVWMERGLYFPTVAGVSAGALNAVNYVSHQPGRSARINLSYRHDPRYFGPLAALRSKGVFGLDFIMRTLAERENFDRATFEASPQRLMVAATDLATGKPAYFEKGHCGDFDAAVIASASMPLVSLPVKVDGGKYLDGGCACPIPLRWAQEEGFDKIVIVCTREKGYRKPAPSQRMVDLYDDFYSDKTLFYATLLTMEYRYNTLMDELEALEDAGEIFVVRPSGPVDIGQFEGDTNKLLALVQRGRHDAENTWDALQAFLHR